MTDLIMVAILSLLPPKADLDAERARLAPFALAIEDAVREAPAIPFSGDAAREATALALVAIASHESGFQQRVITCEKLGAAGDATAFQLLGPMALGPYTRKQVCASPRLAAERAIHVLAVQAGVAVKGAGCPRGPWLAAWQGYASGRCGRPAPITVRRRPNPNSELVLVTLSEDGGKDRCETWAKLARAGGLTGAVCGARKPIGFASTKVAAGG